MPDRDEPINPDSVLDDETAQSIAKQLELIPKGYPRTDEARIGSARQLQRLCTGNDRFTDVEQAIALVTEAVARVQDWREYGWPGMRQLFDELFTESTPAPDISAPSKPIVISGECPKCNLSGMPE